MDIYVFAIDEDNALELLGNGAIDGEEFESVEHALRNYDSDNDGDHPLFRVQVTKVRENGRK